MRKFVLGLALLPVLLTGCGQQQVAAPQELAGFIEILKGKGVDGSLIIREPINEDMEYVAEYSIARYASTRVLSFFKCKDAEKAEKNLQEALKNDKLSGQAVNGSFMMVATFYPSDEEAVEKLKALFLEHVFE